MLNNFRRLLILAGLGLLVGCTTGGNQYQWGNYEDNMFDYYHEAGRKELVVRDHINMLQKPLANGRKFAPGMYAEAATFYLEQGDLEKAIEFYQFEKEAWPESAVLMNALIENLQQRVGPK